MEETSLTPLDPALLRLMRIHAALAGAMVIAAAAVGEAMLDPAFGVPRGLLLGAALLLFLYLLLWVPPRRYRAWGYAMAGDELQVRRGLWTRVHTVVPLDRVQHIDLSQGPIERSLGISSLVLHTAGTLHSQIVVPGLARATAEAIRDEIRARIREEPA